MNNPFVEVPKYVNGQLVAITTRALTPKELSSANRQNKRFKKLLQQQEQANLRIEQFEKTCPHFARYDVEGYILHRRICFVCHKEIGII